MTDIKKELIEYVKSAQSLVETEEYNNLKNVIINEIKASIDRLDYHVRIELEDERHISLVVMIKMIMRELELPYEFEGTFLTLRIFIKDLYDKAAN